MTQNDVSRERIEKAKKLIDELAAENDPEVAQWLVKLTEQFPDANRIDQKNLRRWTKAAANEIKDFTATVIAKIIKEFSTL